MATHFSAPGPFYRRQQRSISIPWRYYNSNPPPPPPPPRPRFMSIFGTVTFITPPPSQPQPFDAHPLPRTFPVAPQASDPPQNFIVLSHCRQLASGSFLDDYPLWLAVDTDGIDHTLLCSSECVFDTKNNIVSRSIEH